MYRTMDASKLQHTATLLAQRIEERFTGAGLGEVSREVRATIEEATRRAAEIRQPNVPLRIGLVVLLILLLAAAGWMGYQASQEDQEAKKLGIVWGLLKSSQGAPVTLVVILLFFWTLETRFKRKKALQAIHELRALAHVVDMHQLSKNPEQFADSLEPIQVGDKMMDPAAMTNYLQLCTEVLAIVSKIGHLYVQDFPDPTSLNAVDQVESLATSLSQKIWQKIMILERMRAGHQEASGTA